MNLIADLHLHSKFSRAVSREMIIPTIAEWGRRKGIDLLATGDWFHSLWFRQLQAELKEVSAGIFCSRTKPQASRFLLGAEISSIYSQGGKSRRIHNLILAPSLATAEKINQELRRRGCNLSSDGRPIIGLSCPQLAEIIFSISQRCLLIPCHVWTPWFSLYGSQSGFDSINECFGEFTDQIYAVETGLSSDPAMNWRIKELENRAILSFSDAHSPAKLGREATVFQTRSNEFSYHDIYRAIAERFLGKNEGQLKIASTIEFYPEEGKYHYTGHRQCNLVQSPQETRKKGAICPVCGKALTVGVMHRVDQLADPKLKTLRPRAQGREAKSSKLKADANGVKSVHHPTDKTRPPYVMLVPLMEILAEIHSVGPNSKRVQDEYLHLTTHLGGEFAVLLKTPVEQLTRFGGQRLAEAVSRVRNQEITVEPGYDGVFGTVKIWDHRPSEGKATASQEQMSLF